MRHLSPKQTCLQSAALSISSSATTGSKSGTGLALSGHRITATPHVKSAPNERARARQNPVLPPCLSQGYRCRGTAAVTHGFQAIKALLGRYTQALIDEVHHCLVRLVENHRIDIVCCQLELAQGTPDHFWYFVDRKVKNCRPVHGQVLICSNTPRVVGSFDPSFGPAGQTGTSSRNP